MYYTEYHHQRFFMSHAQTYSKWWLNGTSGDLENVSDEIAQLVEHSTCNGEVVYSYLTLGSPFSCQSPPTCPLYGVCCTGAPHVRPEPTISPWDHFPYSMVQNLWQYSSCAESLFFVFKTPSCKVAANCHDITSDIPTVLTSLPLLSFKLATTSL